MPTGTREKTGGRVRGTPNKPRSAGAKTGPPAELMPPRARGHDPVGAERAKLSMADRDVEDGLIGSGAAGKFPRYRLAPVADLTPYVNNARTHSPEQIDLIVALIKEYGFTNPVLVDGKRGVIAGHGRVLAALKLGMRVVPTIELSHLSEAQRRAYVIADNQSALKAGWDEDLLRLELGELRDAGFDLALTGFDGLELDTLFGAGTGGLTDPDAVSPVQAVAVSRLGDVWLLGSHRLACGDCTDADVVAVVLAGAVPHLMVTDPPYGVGYDPTWSDGGPAGERTLTFKNRRAGNQAIGAVVNDDRADWREAWALFPGGVAYVWHSALHLGEVAESLAACKYKIRSEIVWIKDRPIVSRGDYHWQHEPLLHAVKDGEDDRWQVDHETADYAVRAGSTGHWQGSRKQSTVWFIEHLRSETGHSTQKPVECMRRPIENNSAPRDAVYDPFVGSGTTIIAGEMTGRVVLAIEVFPAYVDVAIRRWQAFAGAAATLEGDGRTFDAVAAERLSDVSDKLSAAPVVTGKPARARRAAASGAPA